MPSELHTVDRRLTPFWARPGMFAFNLLVMLLDAYGPEALTWDAATLDMELHDDFSVDVPPDNFDRMMTAIALLTTDGFYKSPADFVRACASLSGHKPSGDLIMPDCSDLAWGMTEGMLISPPEEGDQKPFCEEIIGLIEHTLADEGVLTPPDVLAVVGRGISDRTNYDYSNDPEMFGMIQEVEAGKTDEVNKLVAGRTRALLNQLQELPLREGKTDFVARVLASLPSGEAAGLVG